MLALDPVFLKILCSILVLVRAIPLRDDAANDPELYAGFYEGDMEVQVKRNGIIDKAKLWPNNTVYYKIEEDIFSEEQKDFIRLGMEKIQDVSCIRFEEATDNTPYYVNITGVRRGCHAHLGYAQEVIIMNLEPHELGSGCFRIGTILHEFLHLLSFLHQQSAPERDEYVRIVEQNIVEHQAYNFKKLKKGVSNNFGVEYDYGSVMHYRAKAFSKNGKNTILVLGNTDVKLGQRLRLSPSDIVKLNLMYNCVEMSPPKCNAPAVTTRPTKATKPTRPAKVTKPTKPKKPKKTKRPKVLSS